MKEFSGILSRVDSRVSDTLVGTTHKEFHLFLFDRESNPNEGR